MQNLDGLLREYNAGYVRQLTPAGAADHIYLVPGYLSLNRCTSPLDAARLQLSELLGPGHPVASAPVYCVIDVNGRSSQFDCHLFAAVQSGSATTDLVGPRPTSNRIGGLVPDGVSTVVIEFGGGARRTLPVTKNMFVAAAPSDPPALVREVARLLTRLAHRHGRLRLDSPIGRRLNRIEQQIEAARTPSTIRWLGPNQAPVGSFRYSARMGPLVSGGSFVTNERTGASSARSRA